MTNQSSTASSIVTLHKLSVFEELERSPDSVIRKIRMTAADGENGDSGHYDPDVIVWFGLARSALTGSPAELRKRGAVAKFATTQTEGGYQVMREIDFFNISALGVPFSQSAPDLSGGSVTLQAAESIL